MTSLASSSPSRAMLNKVPQVTLAFWAIKIMSTTVGETGLTTLQSMSASARP